MPEIETRSSGHKAASAQIDPKISTQPDRSGLFWQSTLSAGERYREIGVYSKGKIVVSIELPELGLTVGQFFAVNG